MSNRAALTEAPAPARQQRRWLKRPRFWITIAVLAGLAMVLATRCHTPPIRDGRGQILPGSIASLERVRIGGVEQWMLIRGANRNAPVVLFLHGGPGLGLMPLAYSFQRPLEKDFVVVQWDQRGAGKSYSLSTRPEDLKEERFIADTREMAALLAARFQQKIILVGHSWGTYLGPLVVERYPELFRAYVGVGQLGDVTKNAVAQEKFVRERAQATGDKEALQMLAKEGPGSLKILVTRLGGDLHGQASSWPLVKTALHAPEYSLLDYARYLAGLILYYRHVPPALRFAGPGGRVQKLDVPVYFFLGRYDEICPASVAEDFLKHLEAPRKQIVWLEDSAHWGFVEEPERFAEAMRWVRDQTALPAVPR